MTPKQIVYENFRGLDELIEDKDLLLFYKDLIETCLDSYGWQQRKRERRKSEALKKAAEEILHLHLCEQEGMASGKPSPDQWIKAVDKLSEALTPNPKEI